MSCFIELVEMQWSDNNRHSHSLFLLVNAEFGGYSYEDLVWEVETTENKISDKPDHNDNA